MTDEEIARLALLRENQPSVHTPATKKEKHSDVQVSPEIDIDAEALRRMRGQVQPEPLPSREEWQSRNPGADYDKAMKERLENPMQVIDGEDPEEIKYKQTQARLREADQALENKLAKEDNTNYYVAGAGAATGAYLRHKGLETSRFFSPGENVYQPSSKSVEAINEKLRQVTGDPTFDVRGMTPQQIERILQGGEGSTHGTTGAQRMYGFQGEQQRRSRTQNEIENLVNRTHPNTPDPIAQAGKLVPLKSGIEVPVNTAQQVSTQQFNDVNKAVNEASKDLRMSGIKSGATKLGMGTVGGALTALQGYNMATQKQPTDYSQYLSLLGNLGITFGGPRLGAVGAAFQVPYAVKHREDLMRGMTMSDINPTGMPVGTVGSEASPLQEPVKTVPPRTPPLTFSEKTREEGRRAFPNGTSSLLDYLSMPAYFGAIAGRRD
jgi:hypothetical protein